MLRVADLHVHYGSIEALKGIDLEVREGEIVALIGGNGAGKTTTLKTISGLLRPTSGRITLWDRDLTQVPAYRLSHEGIVHVPEGRRCFPRMSVRENLLLGAWGRKTDVSADLGRVFSLFPRLAERSNQVAMSLSGGEQQMLAIGRGLMGRPKILMLDEPSMGLGPMLVKLIFQLITEIHEAGATILLVEQNARMALAIADRAYVLESGRMVLEGAASDLAQNPAVRRSYLGEK
ncbi:MAG: ABC transporter ATP-binding protein [Chloroflexi bacterium GWC2_73_18]|nr:MAG: ABC transporter ATP-binding protein [Chloroflexi bacterium GWC2_73_18]